MLQFYKKAFLSAACIFFLLLGCGLLQAQEYRQIEKEKISFISRYLNLTNQQKHLFLQAVQTLDQNLAEIKRHENENPEQYLLKLRSLNDIFAVQVQQLLASDQQGRWKNFQNREYRAVLECKQKAKKNGWSCKERMNEEIKIRYKYTTLNL
ncbi:MAG TPA: hypothetical protein VJ917_08880 [Saprospiraceae bacterium]|nr:hypothetical protein [Saprospiraceae bacterium]